MEKPSWWPQNPYNYDSYSHSEDCRHLGFKCASDACWEAFCDWLDGVDEFQFLKLKAAVEKELYP